MNPDLAAFGFAFGEPAPIVRSFETLAPAPVAYHPDVTACIEVMHDAYTREGCSEEECFLRAVEKLRDMIGPDIVHGQRTARVSQKAKRRVTAALDHWIAQGRGG